MRARHTWSSTTDTSPRPARRGLLLVVLISVLTLLLGGCANFTDQDRTREEGAFTSNPVPDIVAPDEPTAPAQPGDENTGPPPTGPCVDPDGSVIATCLATTSGVRPADSEGKATYVAERTTGNVIISKRYGPQRVLYTLPVDASGDGGLIDFELSPTYAEDRMIYALITTGSDNRVVMMAPGQEPKPILTGIPKGATGNMGSIWFRSPAELVVATGNAGDPAAATNPSSLAGKILTIGPNGGPPKIVAAGFGSNVSLCPDPSSDKLYAADSGAPEGDRLFEIEQTGPKLLWQWNDRPGIGGCAAGEGAIYVAMTRAKRIDSLMAPTAENPTMSNPTPIDLAKRFGAIGRLVAIPGGVQLATVNKSTAGAPVKSFDDRVAIFDPPQPQESRM